MLPAEAAEERPAPESPPRYEPLVAPPLETTRVEPAASHPSSEPDEEMGPALPVEEPEPAEVSPPADEPLQLRPAVEEPEPSAGPKPEEDAEPARETAARAEEPEPPTGPEPEPESVPKPEHDSEPAAGQLPEPAAEAPVSAAPRGRRSWLDGLRRRPVEPVPSNDTKSPAPEPPAEPQRDRDAEPEPAERAPLRAVEPPVEPPPAAPAPAKPDLAETSVVRLSSRRAVEAREWNIWDLEAVAREESRADPSRRDEWSYLFLHLRQFADAQGTLPAEFDGLVRESFGDLLEIHDLV